MFTGPLPELVNHRKLATENQKLEGVIPLVKFTRLTSSLESDEGNVQVKIEFRRGRKRKTLLIGKASADVALVCQKCLSTMIYSLVIDIRHTVVDSEEALLDSSQDEDYILCLEDRVPLTSLFEDELMVCLPMVSRHSELDEKNGLCKGASEHENDDSPIKGDTHRPFAVLGDAVLSDNRNDKKRS